MSGATGTLRRLGTLPVGQFVARYWQRQPLCIRQALGGFTNPVQPAELRALAGADDVESRLVRSDGGRWRMRHGPFAARALPAAGRPDWTLLVQGVDLHLPAVAALAARFRFLPAARFDDVMVSLAGAGGGVGPHVDQYDVILLQAHGRRRWRIAQHFDPRLVEGLPLRVLAGFRAEREWILEPGDALYLPPGVAHDGVALDECVTISIGFRLPAWQELLEAWQDRQARHAPRAGHMADRTRRPTAVPARLPAAMIDAAARELRRATPSRREAGRTLLEHLTEPKPDVVYAAPARPLAPAAFARALARRALVLDRRSRLLYADGEFAINGELASTTAAMAPVLRRLANRGRLDAGTVPAVAGERGAALASLLHGWYRCGWLQLAAL